MKLTCQSLSCLFSDLLLAPPLLPLYYVEANPESVAPDFPDGWLVAWFGQWELLARDWTVDRREKPRYFSPSQPWARSPAVVMFLPCFVEEFWVL